MSHLRFELAVEMDDGSTFVAVADQRDVAKFEVQPFGFPFGPNAESQLGMSTMRFLAWSAASRQGLTKLDWEAFDAACVEAMPPEVQAPAAPDASHPGRTARSGKGSSGSRARAGSR